MLNRKRIFFFATLLVLLISITTINATDSDNATSTMGNEISSNTHDTSFLSSNDNCEVKEVKKDNSLDKSVKTKEIKKIKTTNDKNTSKTIKESNIKQSESTKIIKNTTGSKTIKTATYERKTNIKAQVISNKAINTTFKLTVKDSYNNPVTYGTVYAYDNNNYMTYGVVENGVTTIYSTSSVGKNHIFTFYYYGTSTYSSSSTTRTVNIYKSPTTVKAQVINNKVTDTSFKVTVKSGNNYVDSGRVILYDEYGNSIANEYVNDGIAYISTTANLGNNQKFTFKYSDDYYYESSQSSRTVSIYKSPTNIKVQIMKNNVKNTTFKVTVKSGENNVNSGYVYVYDYYGNYLDKEYVYDGVATITRTPSAGYHEYTFVYKGDSNYKQSNSVTRSLSVYSKSYVSMSSKKITVGNNAVMTAKITTDKGTTVNSGYVYFYVNGVYKKSVKVSNGKATYTTTSRKPKTLTIKAVYKSDSSYVSSSSKEATLKFKDIPLNGYYRGVHYSLPKSYPYYSGQHLRWFYCRLDAYDAMKDLIDSGIAW